MKHQALEQLNNSWKKLQSAWADTQQGWRDPVQVRFQRHYWRPYAETVPRIERGLGQVLEMADKAVKSCP